VIREIIDQNQDHESRIKNRAATSAQGSLLGVDLSSVGTAAMKVLICDDDSATRFALKRVLLRFECSVVEAADGMAALDILSLTSVAFMLDVHMPVLSGVEVLQAIRSSPQHANLPVIIISAAADQLTVSELIRLGVADFLTKPLKADKAAARITTMIQSLGVQRASAPRAISGPLDGTRPLVIVDGDPEFRHFVGNLLSARCPVIEAESGLDALPSCRKVKRCRSRTSWCSTRS
jgi:CheY-like chemotaxis protein